MTTKTILLINREPSLRELMQAYLSYFGGWKVLTTASPSEGLQRAIQVRPDAIVLDVNTSSTDCSVFLQKLRAQSATRPIPVVLMTAGVKWNDVQRLQQLDIVGAIDYFPDPSQIPEQIATLLGWEILELAPPTA
jgi:two-component system, OmpR family, alkaline phosphatase synthesis response regulator PhoP